LLALLGAHPILHVSRVRVKKGMKEDTDHNHDRQQWYFTLTNHRPENLPFWPFVELFYS
jgi:hypothetical protein